MHIASATSPPRENIKTGRRENPAIDGPRDKTVCFMLSDEEKQAVDRVAFCVHLTRSGLLAKIVAPFIAATENGGDAKAAEKQLTAYLRECRAAVAKRGAFADKTFESMKENP
jgi:hypothetical protein